MNFDACDLAGRADANRVLCFGLPIVIRHNSAIPGVRIGPPVYFYRLTGAEISG
jgi:hypothetical protein